MPPAPGLVDVERIISNVLAVGQRAEESLWRSNDSVDDVIVVQQKMIYHKSSQFSLLRLMLATTFVAGAAGCFYWAQRLVLSQTGHDHLVAGLVFAIPALLGGALFCLARSLRSGILAFVAIFGGIAVLAVFANALVPMLK
jgi:hypothetical protein